MPRLPLPRELDELVGRANPAVVATVRPDGAPHTAATWYDWEGGRVLLNPGPEQRFPAAALRGLYVLRGESD